MSLFTTVLLVSALVAQPTVTCTYSFNRNLQTGSSGADVAELQVALEEKKFLSGTAFKKGYFGEETRAALARYQEINDIKPSNGVFDAATRGRLGTRQVVGGSRTFDLPSLCSPGRFSFAGLFGHTEIEILGTESGNCRLRYGAESENPDWDGVLDRLCIVPMQVWEFDYSDQIGIELSPIAKFCKVAR